MIDVLVYDVGFSEVWMLLTKELVFEILSEERCPSAGVVLTVEDSFL